jgi:hypothetical protein
MSVSRWIAVAPSGSDEGGAEAHASPLAALGQPLATLDAALRRAVPGTGILLREGEYRENLMLTGRDTPALRRLGPEAPLVILGIDGLDAEGRPRARLLGRERRSTIYIAGISHVRLHNLEVGGAAGLGEERDEAPIKFIGAAGDVLPEQAGGWLEVAGCRIAGEGVDAIKAGKGQRLRVIGCRFDVNVRESMVDYVSVIDSEVRNCEFDGHAQDGAAAKGASGRILWDGNIFRYSGNYCCAIGWQSPAITIGGISWSQVTRDMAPDRWNVECYDSVARRNLFAGAFENAVVFWGARDCLVEQNFVAHSGAPGRPWGARYAWRSNTAPSYPWRNQWSPHVEDPSLTWPQARELAPAIEKLGYAPSSGNVVRDNTYAAGKAYAPGFSKNAAEGEKPNVVEGTRLATEAEWRAEVGPIGVAAYDATAIYAELGLPA